jgi:hypothetical protein
MGAYSEAQKVNTCSVVEVNRDTSGHASAEATMITGATVGHELDDQKGVPRRMWRPPMIIYPNPVELVPARPVAQGSKVSRAHRRRCRG